jgi:molecular chaperone HtpG
LRNYKEKDIVDAAKENLNLEDEEDEESKKRKEELKAEYKEVASYLETLLKEKVQKVVVTDLLTDSPAALVQAAYGMSPTMQRYMRAQSVASGGDGSFPGMGSQTVMEVNCKHPIIKDMDRMVKEDKESKELEEFALLLYDVAAMTSGYDVRDTKSFAKRVMRLMDPTADLSGGGSSDESSSISNSSTSSKSDDVKSADGDGMEATPVEVIQ